MMPAGQGLGQELGQESGGPMCGRVSGCSV